MEDPDDDNSNSTPQSPEEEALEAMMALQQQQAEQDLNQDEQVEEYDEDDEDDPNVMFLQDDENQIADNPAAIALRRHLEQHRALRNNNGSHTSLSQYISSHLRYTPLSFFLAFLLIFHTLRTRQQFYLTILYLQSSKLSYIVLGNALIASGVGVFTCVTNVFLGGLRVNERDGIGEHIRWDVTETCLALTIFRSELDVVTAVLFLGLVVVKW